MITEPFYDVTHFCKIDRSFYIHDIQKMVDMYMSHRGPEIKKMTLERGKYEGNYYWELVTYFD